MSTKIVMLGPPGSGKGTHAELISKKLNIPRISTGDMLRAEAASRSELGKKIEWIMNQGKLVPDDIVIEITKKKLQNEDCKNCFILDGFPRTLYQAEQLELITQIDIVLNIEVELSEIVKRLGGRLSCPKCNAIYHVTNKPPKKTGICDYCSSKLYIREDDKKTTIKKRFETYSEETEPLITYYQDKNLLKTVDGNGTIEETSKRILAILE